MFNSQPSRRIRGGYTALHLHPDRFHSQVNPLGKPVELVEICVELNGMPGGTSGSSFVQIPSVVLEIRFRPVNTERCAPPGVFLPNDVLGKIRFSILRRPIPERVMPGFHGRREWRRPDRGVGTYRSSAGSWGEQSSSAYIPVQAPPAYSMPASPPPSPFDPGIDPAVLMLSRVVSSVQSRAMMGPDAGLTCAAAVAALSLLEQLESTLLASVHAERQDLYAQIIWHKRSALGIATSTDVSPTEHHIRQDAYGPGGERSSSEGESCAGLVSSSIKTSGGNRLSSRHRQRLRRLQLELGSSTAASASASGGQPSGATVPKAEVAAEAFYPRTRLRAVVLRWMRRARWHRMQCV